MMGVVQLKQNTRRNRGDKPVQRQMRRTLDQLQADITDKDIVVLTVTYMTSAGVVHQIVIK